MQSTEERVRLLHSRVTKMMQQVDHWKSECNRLIQEKDALNNELYQLKNAGLGVQHTLPKADLGIIKDTINQYITEIDACVQMIDFKGD